MINDNIVFNFSVAAGIMLLGLFFLKKHKIYGVMMLIVLLNLFLDIFTLSAVDGAAFVPVWMNRLVRFFWFALQIGLLLALAFDINFGKRPYFIDKVSHIYNREAFFHIVTEKFKSAVNFSVLVVALDDFKSINRILGLSCGDEIIEGMGSYLKELGKEKEIFRYVGDEFLLLVSDEDEGRIKAQRIRERFNKPFWVKDSRVMLSATLCYIPMAELVSNAGEAADMVESSVKIAKARARGGFYRIASEDAERIRRQEWISGIIGKAVEEKGFEVYYQPIFSVKENRITAAEALIRLNRADMGFVSPEEFIPLAEKNGQILAIGNFVLEQVCQFISGPNFASTGLDYIEVNISAVQCMQKNFAENILEKLRFYQVNPEQINFEITETAMDVSEGVLNRVMEQLYEYGIRFSMDDFGSGYSNLGNIQELPFSIVKLDKKVFWRCWKAKESVLMLRTLAVMIHTMRKKIVVEGVETAEQLELVKKLHIDFVQGYYYSKPLPEKDFLAYLL